MYWLEIRIIITSNLVSLSFYHIFCQIWALPGGYPIDSWCVVILQVHGQKAGWEDPVEWVRGTLPWPSAQQDQAKLFHLPPPSIDSSSPGQSLEERPHKETPPSSMESDPLVRLQRESFLSKCFKWNKSFFLIQLAFLFLDGYAFETSRSSKLYWVTRERRP